MGCPSDLLAGRWSRSIRWRGSDLSRSLAEFVVLTVSGWWESGPATLVYGRSSRSLCVRDGGFRSARWRIGSSCRSSRCRWGAFCLDRLQLLHALGPAEPAVGSYSTADDVLLDSMPDPYRRPSAEYQTRRFNGYPGQNVARKLADVGNYGLGSLEPKRRTPLPDISSLYTR